MQAACLIHTKFWGKDLDELLKPVSGHGHLKYLSKEQTLPLRIGLLYGEEVLLVRQDYDVTYNDILSYKLNPRTRGVVVTGQPGIGKTCFLYYLLLRLLNRKQPVAFQVFDHYFLFDSNGGTLHDDRARSGTRIPPGTWALSDSNYIYTLPCPAFIFACQAKHAVIVHTTSPLRISEMWIKEHSAIKHWMKVITLDEIAALSTILNLDLQSLVKNYSLWGPSARTCISLLDSAKVVEHQMAVTSLAVRFTRKFDEFCELDMLWEDKLVSHRLIVVEPANDSRQRPTVKIPSHHLLEFVSRAYADLNSAARHTLYDAISGHPWFASSAGHIFETSVLLWLRHSAAEEHLLCVAAEEGSPVLRIPSCRDRMQFFHKLSDLKNADRYELHERPMCLVPAVQTFPSLDAIILTNEFVITVQTTVASSHDAKDSGFGLVYDGLPMKFCNARTRCHVFLTDTETKATSLRTQILTNIRKEGICLYSAFVDVSRFDSTLTGERMRKLQENRGEAEEMKVDMTE